MVLEKTLESPLDYKEIKMVNPKGNQPWIFTGRTDTETQYFTLHNLMQRADSLEETLMQGKLESKRRGWQRWDGWMVSPDSIVISFSKLWEIVKYRKAWHGAVNGVAKSRTLVSDWSREQQSWKCQKSEMHLPHLTYTSSVSLACLKYAWSTYISLYLGKLL